MYIALEFALEIKGVSGNCILVALIFLFGFCQQRSTECLGLMDLDPALEDTPTEPTDSSSPEEKSKNQEWERSNRMSLLLMKCKMSKTSAALCLKTTMLTKECARTHTHNVQFSQ